MFNYIYFLLVKFVFKTLDLIWVRVFKDTLGITRRI